MDNKSGEDAIRRRRINRYKKIIIFSMLTMIILPTILCIVLFFRMSSLERKLDRYMNGTLTKDFNEDDSSKNTGEDGTTDEKDTTQSLVSADKDTENTVKTEPDTSSEAVRDTEKDTENSSEKDSMSLSTVKPYRNWTDEQLDIIERYKGMGEGKKIYLTFDDGPSIYTKEILDILEYYNVKATFFVLGKEDETSLEGYRAIAASGNIIGLHSYSHQYENIYSSVEAFEADLLKVKNLVSDVTGIESKYYRFPGGTSTSKTVISVYNFIDYLNANGYVYFDWNSTCGDGAAHTVPMEKIVTNVMDDAIKYKNVIALLHDAKSKRTTVDGLPLLIETLINSGFEICPIDDATVPVQHRKRE